MTVETDPEEVVHLKDAGVNLDDIARKDPPRRDVPLPIIEEEIEAENEGSYRMPVYTPAPMPLPTAPDAGADSVSKAKKAVISKIMRYKQSFEVLHNYPVDTNATVGALEAQLEEMRLVINTKNSHAIFRHLYLTGVKGYEFAGNKVGMKLYGLADLLSKSPEVDQILKELECEYHITGSLKPEQRLLLVTASTSLVVDSLNRRSELLNKFGKDKVNEGLQAQFSDL
jgi:hypothetical protein